MGSRFLQDLPAPPGVSAPPQAAALEEGVLLARVAALQAASGALAEVASVVAGGPSGRTRKRRRQRAMAAAARAQAEVGERPAKRRSAQRRSRAQRVVA